MSFRKSNPSKPKLMIASIAENGTMWRAMIKLAGFGATFVESVILTISSFVSEESACDERSEEH